MAEIRRWRDLLPRALRWDPDFAISSPNWDTFSQWEWHPDRRAGYLSDANWARDWSTVASSDDNSDGDDYDEEEDEDFHEHGA
jgi:hypothetical protein